MLFTTRTREGLRAAYNQALANGATAFTFDNTTFVTGYTKYLLEHLDNVFKSEHSIYQYRVQS